MIHSFAENDVFLVTGATSGIGEGVVLSLLRNGAKVIAVGRHHEKLNNLRLKANSSKRLECEVCNLAGGTKLDQWVLEISRKYGKLRGLVLSAGLQHIVPLQASATDEKTRELFEINYFANIQLAKGFCDRRSHVSGNSAIVFVSSIASIRGSRGLVGYASSKGAVNAAVRSISTEVAPLGIRVNAILPGFVRTNMNELLRHVYTDDVIAELDRSYPLGIGDVDSVVEPILFLLSDAARWVTGTELVVDGGASSCSI